MNNLLKDLVNKFKSSLKHRIIYISIITIYVLVILCCIIPLNKEVTTPGVLNNPSEFITIGNSELGEVTYDKGNINTIGVYVTYKPTLFQYLISQNKNFSIADYDTSSDLSPKDNIKRSTYLKDLSIENAIITAYTSAQIKDSKINIEYEYQGLLVTANLPVSYSHELKIGDLIVGVTANDVYYDIVNINDKQYLAYVLNILKPLYSENKTFDFKVRRGDGLIDVEFKWMETGSLGLELKPKFNIINTYPSYNIDEKTVHNSIGSSGGMMLTLAIYNSLIEEDITHGLLICGTGTVNESGMIGAIGGIKQKISTSQLYKADIFFCPYSLDESSSEYHNYVDAYTQYQLISKPTFKLIKVTSFNDILNELERIGEDNENI